MWLHWLWGCGQRKALSIKSTACLSGEMMSMNRTPGPPSTSLWESRCSGADREHVQGQHTRRLQGLDGRGGRGVGSAGAGVALRSAGTTASPGFRRAVASAVTSAEMRSRTPSSPGPDVVFNSSAARRKASRRSSRDVVASNSGSGRFWLWSAIAYSYCQGISSATIASVVIINEPPDAAGCMRTMSMIRPCPSV
jgi:hypothetical protein